MEDEKDKVEEVAEDVTEDVEKETPEEKAEEKDAVTPDGEKPEENDTFKLLQSINEKMDKLLALSAGVEESTEEIADNSADEIGEGADVVDETAEEGIEAPTLEQEISKYF